MTPQQSERVVLAVLSKHNRKTNQEAAFYEAMVESIQEPEARAILLRLVSKELEIRVAVVRQLAMQNHLHPSRTGTLRDQSTFAQRGERVTQQKK